MNLVERIVEADIVPTPLLRAAIRGICAQRLRDERRRGDLGRLVATLGDSPVAVATDRANDQHYQVPPRFFELVLGPHLKYSSGYFPPGVSELPDAEAAMLALTAERAGLADGQEILELGCGWGSLTLFMAARYPRARITAVSNAPSQRRYIEALARGRGLDNVRIVTADLATLSGYPDGGAAPDAPWADWSGRFDRVVSVEMFEHMRNWRALLAAIATWLRPDGRLFLHVFAHHRHAYLYDDAGASDWMARQFFTGGTMPSPALLAAFQDDLRLVDQWQLPGTHYARTAEAWLANLERNRAPLLELFAAEQGTAAAPRRLAAWKVFFLACAEMFGYRHGTEWIVAHALYAPLSR
jgi:cyclopropane-fatty-acyl-phospholipid synthase